MSEASLLRVLRRTPLAQWHLLAVLRTPEGDRVISRGDLAQWLRQNDLGGLAHDATALRVPPTKILVFTISESAPPAFKVIPSEAP